MELSEPPLDPLLIDKIEEQSSILPGDCSAAVRMSNFMVK